MSAGDRGNVSGYAAPQGDKDYLFRELRLKRRFVATRAYRKTVSTICVSRWDQYAPLLSAIAPFAHANGTDLMTRRVHPAHRAKSGQHAPLLSAIAFIPFAHANGTDLMAPTFIAPHLMACHNPSASAHESPAIHKANAIRRPHNRSGAAHRRFCVRGSPARFRLGKQCLPAGMLCRARASCGGFVHERNLSRGH